MIEWASRQLRRAYERREASDETRARGYSPYADQVARMGGEFGVHRFSRHATAHACIAVKATTLAAVSLKVYERTPDGGRREVIGTPLRNCLNDRFNGTLTAFEGREALSAQLDVHGNAFSRFETNGRGQVIALHPMDPRAVTVERLPGGRLRYRCTDLDGVTRVLLGSEVLHVRHWSEDGVLGVSSIQRAARTMSLAVEQSDQAEAMAGNGFQPGGILSFPESLTNEQVMHLRSMTQDRYAGGAKAGRLMVLDGGAVFHKLAMSSSDAEFLESRKLSNLDVARLFSVPPTVVGITDNATYSNVTQENRAFVARCLAPWAKRIEAAMNAALLTEEQRRTMFIEHDLSGLLRGDLEARFEVYRIGREGGWLSVNDIRTMENMSPIEGGEKYLQPLNMADAAKWAGDADS